MDVHWPQLLDDVQRVKDAGCDVLSSPNRVMPVCNAMCFASHDVNRVISGLKKQLSFEIREKLRFPVQNGLDMSRKNVSLQNKRCLQCDVACREPPLRCDALSFRVALSLRKSAGIKTTMQASAQARCRDVVNLGDVKLFFSNGFHHEDVVVFLLWIDVLPVAQWCRMMLLRMLL